ncbi:MAG: PRC-barrel domain-containing protein [Gammaproteobacteria bacterium]
MKPEPTTTATPGPTPTTGRTLSGHTSAIRAAKVIGTDVRNRKGEKLGDVKDVVLDKLSNNILFVVVSFGGFLGIAEKFHPIPWSTLDYDEEAGAYVIDATRQQLEAAPSDSMSELLRDNGVHYRDRSFQHYQSPGYR